MSSHRKRTQPSASGFEMLLRGWAENRLYVACQGGCCVSPGKIGWGQTQMAAVETLPSLQRMVCFDGGATGIFNLFISMWLGVHPCQ